MVSMRTGCSIITNCPFISTNEDSGVEGSSEMSLDRSINSHYHIFSINFVWISEIPSATIMDVDDDVDGKLLAKDSNEVAGGYHREYDCAKDGFTGREGSWNLGREPARVMTLIRHVVGMPYCIVQHPY